MKGRNIQAIIFSVILAVTFIVRLDSERMGTRFLVLGIGVLGIILIRFAESIAELVNEWRARGYNKNPVDPTPTRGAIIAERVSGYCYYIISLVAIILI